MAFFYAMCDDRPIVTASFDLDRLQANLHTAFLGRNASYLETTETTMEIARHEAEAGAPEGAIVLAGEQTAGRGRMGRSWLSPAGNNIYASLILRPARGELRYLSVIAPLAVCLAIEETTNLMPRIKWPNDVQIDGKKVAGVLTQTELSDGGRDLAITGIGINVNMDVTSHQEIREIATSLRNELGRYVSCEDVLAALLNHFEPLLLALRRGEVVSMDWKQRLDTIGEHVRVSGPDGALLDQGVAVDADSDGSLILRRDGGAYVRIEAGELTLR